MFILRKKTGLPVLDTPPLIGREQGGHVGASIGAVDYIAGAGNHAAISTLILSTTNYFLYAVPFISPNYPSKCNRLAIEVTTGRASATGEMGLFENTEAAGNIVQGDHFRPGKMLAKSGSLDLSSAALVTYSISPAVSLIPGRLYWVVFGWNFQNPSVALRACPSSGISPSIGMAPTASSSLPASMVQSTATVPWIFTDGVDMSGVWSVNSLAPALRYRLTS